jgi:MerR family transcriptional regulator, thiopeptide resistance regulator
MAFTVSQVARMSLVSVRTLHHYDEIGLLRPSGRSEAGYRLYGDGDLQRLQQILFFRELELSLEEIARILDDPAFDVGSALRMQRQMLTERAVKVGALIKAVDAAIAHLEKGAPSMSHKNRDDEEIDVFAAWREFKQEDHEEESRQRWGEGEAYKESKKRTSRYTKEDWEALGKEAGGIYRKVMALMEAGTPADSEAAMDAAEEHRQHISRWFYPCPRQMHQGLGELYVNDARFTANIDRMKVGMSRYLCDAFRANAGR